jgi:hypothetical protein
MGIAILVLACMAVDRAWAQAAARTAPAASPAVAAATPGTGGGWITPGLPFRRMAPGVMQDVTADPKADETVEHHDITELPFEFAKDVSFRHEVWMLEFKYKPIRMIWAYIPGPGARMQRKQIWYMVYQVTNRGKAFRAVETDDKLYKLVTVDKPVRFAPVFTLEVHSVLRKEVEGSVKGYVEQYIPIVLPAIQAREDKHRDFLSSEQMPRKELAVGETAWGVATWQDVDPYNVWFSVYVEGLTNAYTFSDDPAKYAAKANEPFREIRTKVLKINFWRPGDEYTVRENQVRPGVPELTGGPPSKPPNEWVWWKTYPPPPANKAVPPAN